MPYRYYTTSTAGEKNGHERKRAVYYLVAKEHHDRETADDLRLDLDPLARDAARRAKRPGPPGDPTHG
jgi:hypothetical protein